MSIRSKSSLSTRLDVSGACRSGRPPAARTRDSSKAGSSKAIEQVLTGSSRQAAPSSRRPRSNRRRRTGRRRAALRRSCAGAPTRAAASISSSQRVGLARCGCRSVKRTSQYSRGSRQRLAAPHAAACAPGGSLCAPLEDRARLGHVAEREVVLDRAAGRCRARSPPCASSDFSSEPKTSVPSRQQRVVQRLDAEAVARQEQRLLVAVPQREREHAAEALDAVLAPRLPGVHDDLGVAARAEDVAERLQLGDQLLVVVDLAVEDDDDAAVLVEQRLLAGREVDDRQAAVAEADARLDVKAAFVGAAMVLRSRSCARARARDRRAVRGCRRCRRFRTCV